jgi:hypothetical protein
MLRKPRTDEPNNEPPEDADKNDLSSDISPEYQKTIKRPVPARWDKFLNILIGSLTVIVIALVISLIIRLNSSPADNNKSDVTTEIKETNGSSENNEEGQPVKSQTVRVEVLNGTEVPRLAAKAADFLRSKGYDVVQTGNAKHTNFRKSVIQDRMGNMQNAMQVANILGVSESNVLQQKNPQLYLDVTVILGQDYKSLKFMNPSR